MRSPPPRTAQYQHLSMLRIHNALSVFTASARPCTLPLLWPFLVCVAEGEVPALVDVLGLAYSVTWLVSMLCCPLIYVSLLRCSCARNR